MLPSGIMRTMTLIVTAAACLAAACGSSATESASVAAAPATTSGLNGTVPRNAIVTLLPAEPVPMREGPAVVDQYAKQSVPNVLYVRDGQPVEFRHSEDLPHDS